MKLVNLQANVHRLETDEGVVLFSHETPVAVRVFGKRWLREEHSHSVTTSKHIAIYSSDPVKVSDAEFVTAIKEVLR